MSTKRHTYATGTNVGFLESMYESFRDNPETVDLSWRKFFEGYEFALDFNRGTQPNHVGENHGKVEAYINAFRRLGHLSADLNPLQPRTGVGEELKPEKHGLANIEQGESFKLVNFANANEMKFSEIFKTLEKTYCGHIGADFREVNNIEAVSWLQNEMEKCSNSPDISNETRQRIYKKLAEAEGFERFLQARYLGQKRFSLEGLESLIPLLDSVFNEAADLDVEEVNLGMAHRGRLNVLANIMQKPLTKILREFEGSDINPFDIDGDVKYHLGFASDVKTSNNKSLRVYLSPNPSHLEAVNPVVLGLTRCRQDIFKDEKRDKILSVLLHGDASFIGQGIVSETLNMSGLKDYEVGGTLHIITNNQIGFTTNPSDSRSCSYSSDICKVIRAPVFHVNADNPEAVVWVSKLAVNYRKKFGGDVVIDLVGYRRHGHNETDEPSFTQPLMYKIISQKKSVLAVYGSELEKNGVYGSGDLKIIQNRVKERLQLAYDSIKKSKIDQKTHIEVPDKFKNLFNYRKVDRKEVFKTAITSISRDSLLELGHKVVSYPDTFTVHPKLKKLLTTRKKMFENDGNIDWGLGEILAFASLAKEGFDVRLSGQDCKRGTFTSRHGVFFDFNSGEIYEPLNSIGPGKVDIVNSPLSEQGCLGFEFGYSVADPNVLVLWEAQFGDFANGAQIIIDQFISASEAKWQQTSGLVMMLPHGFEGMGPEHSSARPERFLQSCGNLNIQVCNVTTPAQMFHLLRRQQLRNFRKPLIIMTPKSLLRHPKVRSKLTEFTDQNFFPVIDGVEVKDPEKVVKAIFCTGKIYYELIEVRDQIESYKDVPIIRIEQLYPFPFEQINELVFEKYKNLSNVFWVQEEPQNMGGWNFVRPRLKSVMSQNSSVKYVGRKHSGSTAEGSGKAHQLEQQRILEQAFGNVCAWDPINEESERQKLEDL